MTIICPVCKYENDDDVEFCIACGTELSLQPETPIVIPTAPQAAPSPSEKDRLDEIFEPITARLILRAPSSLSKEFIIERSCAMVGRFDPDSGPVDIDLDELVGGETVSRNHAEIYREDGQWKVKDLDSENHTFIRRSGQPRFSSAITKPEILNPDDEIAFAKVHFIFKSP